MAGLTTAWHLLEAGLSPCVLEATPHVGGLVRTIELEGRRLELGADTLVTQKAAAPKKSATTRKSAARTRSSR